MNSSIKTSLYVIGLLFAGSCGWYLSSYYNKNESVIAGEVIASVNGKGLEKEWFIEQMKMRGGLKPGQFQTIEHKQALLDALIAEEIVYQQAIDHGIGDDPAVSHLYKKTVIDKFLSENLNQQLKKVKVGNSEVERYFDSNQSDYSRPARRRAAVIFAEVNADDSEEVKAQKLTQINDALEAVTDMDIESNHFGELAKIYSDDRASMYQGGVIGWLINHPSRKYKWDQQVIDALFALESPGDTSGVLNTENGHYIVRLVDNENVQEKSFNQVKKGIKNQLLIAKQKQTKAAFMDNLLNQAEVSVNKDVLASVPTLSPAAKDNNKTPPAMPSVGGAL